MIYWLLDKVHYFCNILNLINTIKMKTRTIGLLILLVVVSFISCEEKEEPQTKYFSEAQKTALHTFEGTYENVMIIPGVDTLKTTIVFLEQYNPPLEATYTDYDTKEKTTFYVHGKYRHEYAFGNTTSEEYYYVSADADYLYSFPSLSTMSVSKQNLQIVSNTSFKIKELKDYLWDTYNKVVK